MIRCLVPALVLLLGVVGCQTPQDRLPPDLPDAVAPRPYAELLTRARAQARVATETYYMNKWADLDDAARGLQQTASYLGKAEEVPASRKPALVNLAKDLGDQAKELRAAVATKDEMKTTAILTKINEAVRSMRIDE